MLSPIPKLTPSGMPTATTCASYASGCRDCVHRVHVLLRGSMSTRTQVHALIIVLRGTLARYGKMRVYTAREEFRWTMGSWVLTLSLGAT